MKFTVALIILSWIAVGFCGAYASIVNRDLNEMWAFIPLGVSLTIGLLVVYGICKFVELLVIELLHLTGLRKRADKPFSEVSSSKNGSSQNDILDHSPELSNSYSRSAPQTTENRKTLPEFEDSPNPSTELPKLRSTSFYRTYKTRFLHKWRRLNQRAYIRWLRFNRVAGPQLRRSVAETSKVLATTASAVSSEVKSSYKQWKIDADRRRQQEEIELKRRIEEVRRLEEENLRAQAERPKITSTKFCHYCGEEILTSAIRCKHCHSDLVIRAGKQATTSTYNSGIAAVLSFFIPGLGQLYERRFAAFLFFFLPSFLMGALFVAASIFGPEGLQLTAGAILVMMWVLAVVDALFTSPPD